MEWFRKFWISFQNRQGRREDAVLSIFVTVNALFADSWLHYTIVGLGLALMVFRLIADWRL